ncbi:MAG: GNAT family N-acetyltransferase [candidate division Zixibacteria bacterium]|nr:GNAT family N-acetyltransferase [candidate division Zixibacteria bacterium]
MLHKGEIIRSPFEIDVNFDDPFRKAFFGIVRRPLQKVLRLSTLDKKYQLISGTFEQKLFIEQALNMLNVCLDVSEDDMKRIPAEGPVIVVANHPFGAIEGLLLASLLTSVRSDVKILANYLLARIPQIAPLIIQVDPFGSKKASLRNRSPLKQALGWVKQGSVLGIFPAGEVSHLKLKNREIADPSWSVTLGKLVRRTQAPVLPVFFDGRNSALFQIMGMIHKRLRTAMLPHELLNKSNKRILASIGNPIPFSRMNKIESDAELTEYIRLRTYLLAKRRRSSGVIVNGFNESIPSITMEEPIANPIDQSALIREVEGLPEPAVLTRNGDYIVYHSRTDAIPLTMHEIGRLREVTFRGAGEGTGKSLDVDHFDDYYIQLFVWNSKKKEVVGAYRLGLVDEIIERYGLKGLYTRTLFKYKHKLIHQINPAIELGRSFVRPEYQKEYTPLHLLWKGLGQFVANNPEYRMMFGPVSINNSYQTASRQLMVRFLKENNFANDLAKLVKPRSPLKSQKPRRWHEQATGKLVTDIDEVSALIAEIETNGQGIPILLRHYLRLGGKLLGFNIDPEFSDVLDGLILVDLTQTPVRILEKYLGKTRTAEFLDYHKSKNSNLTSAG